MIREKMIQIGDLVLGEDEKSELEQVITSSRISEGPKVSEFERIWADFIGTKYAIALNSGTSALIAGILALQNLNDNHNNEKSKIVTSPLTYTATSNSILLTGNMPIYVDVDPYTYCITPDNVKAHLETVNDIDNYNIILPVHLMGYPCDMKKMNKIANRYGIDTFEDSAQAHGTTIDKKRTGALSRLSDFSFYIAHNVQAGEMGIITTDDYNIVRMIRKIKANGRICDCNKCTRQINKCPRSGENIDPRFLHDMVGYNFKASEFHAAIGIAQARKVNNIIKKRNFNFNYLSNGLEKLSDTLRLPIDMKGVSHFAYPLVIEDTSLSRNKICELLANYGVETRPLFGCIPTQQPAYRCFYEQYKNILPNAENIGNNGFYVGCHQYLTIEDLDYIINSIYMAIKEAHH